MSCSDKLNTSLATKADIINLDQSKEWQIFVDKHGDVKSYAHFDRRTSLRNPKVQEMVCDPQWVSSHGFLPFIQYQDDDGRTIYYAAHLDRCIYQRYSFLLNNKYEAYVHSHGFSDAAIAYRSKLGKSNIDFAKQAFDFIKDLNNKDAEALIFVSDFSHFFDNIRHKLLKEKLCKVLGVKRLEHDFYQVFKSITKYAYWDWFGIYRIRLYSKNRAVRMALSENVPGISKATIKNRLKFLSYREINASERVLAPKLFRDFKRTFMHKHKDGWGIPQGASISSILSNVYMVDLDQAINDYVLRKNGLYLRYCDDFIIILPFHHHDNPEVLSSAIDFELSALSYRGFDSLWSTYGLNLNVEKTHLFLIQGQELKEIDFSNYCKNFDCIKNCDQSNQTFQQDSSDVASKSECFGLSECLRTPVSSPSTYQIIDDKACINFLGFSFNGKGVKIDPALIDKYNNGMRRKAKAIVDCDFTTKFNHHINCRELYRLYSGVTGEVNFVSYLKRCAATMELDDPKALDIIKNNKRNIANTLNRLKRKRAQALAAAQKKRARELFPEIFKK